MARSHLLLVCLALAAVATVQGEQPNQSDANIAQAARIASVCKLPNHSFIRSAPLALKQTVRLDISAMVSASLVSAPSGAWRIQCLDQIKFSRQSNLPRGLSRRFSHTTALGGPGPARSANSAYSQHYCVIAVCNFFWSLCLFLCGPQVHLAL